ncbi:MAG: NAD(P)H-dependent oxidoreductase [Oscillospiraceae bacterium]|nr:NAD(P)H-dependent oxidoreductase [Oscillospiraceae bacterium]
MEILVINGSPKGKNSVTLQTVNYLQILHPEHHFEVLHAGQSIKALEKDFSPAIAAIKKADILLFSYPVYTFIAPSQLHRFIELLKAAKLDLSGKYASQISTSKHFYDMTAHSYIQDNCADLGLRFIRGLSADMDDLTTKKGQQEAVSFFDYLCWSVEQGIFETFPKPVPSAAALPVSVPESTAAEKNGDVVIVADLGDEDVQLQRMIERFRAVLPRKTRVVNIREYPFRGGCLGCFNCAVSGKCIYKDGFDDYLRNQIQTAESIVYAFTIRDHSMGARFKLYDDRQFCNGHRTVTIGMSVGYLISGNLSCEQNLQTIIEARAQVGSNHLAGIATDTQDPDHAIDQLCARLNYALEHRYLPPQNFYGIGGMKVFRDLIWLMQGMMKADHKFYKSHGQYDFPQKQWPRMLAMYAVGAMLSSRKLKAKMGSAMTDGMLMPYNKVLEQARKEKAG